MQNTLAAEDTGADNGAEQLFRDRAHAGAELAAALERYRGPDRIVLGCAPGGVPIGYQVARGLGVLFDVRVALELRGRHPRGFGAVGEGGQLAVAPDLVRRSGITTSELGRLIDRQWAAAQAEARRWRRNRPRLHLAGKTVLLVDDGLASEWTLRGVIAGIRREGPRRVILALPVAALETVTALAREVDDTVCLFTRAGHEAIAASYAERAPISEELVVELVERGQIAFTPRDVACNESISEVRTS